MFHDWGLVKLQVPNLQLGLVHSEPVDGLCQFLKSVILLSNQVLVLQ